MALEQKPVRVIQVDYKCNVCGEGYYRPTGMVLTTYPAQYPHECNKCGNGEVFEKSYTCLRYVVE